MKLVAVCLSPTDLIKWAVNHVHSEVVSLLHCSHCWQMGTASHQDGGFHLQGPCEPGSPMLSNSSTSTSPFLLGGMADIFLGTHFFHPSAAAWTLTESSLSSRTYCFWRQSVSIHWKDPLFHSSMQWHREKTSGCCRSCSVPGTCPADAAFCMSVTIASIVGFPQKEWIQNNW